MTTNASEAALRALAGGKFPVAVPRGDGQRFARAAVAHGLAGVAVAAADRGLLTVEPESLAVLSRGHARALRLATVLALESRRLAPAFADDGLPLPIMLKGPAVSSLYAEPVLRPYVDLDLMVPVALVREYGRVLEGAGYGPATEWHYRSMEAGYAHQAVFRRSAGEGRLTVEMHSCLSLERRASRVKYEQLVDLCDELRPGLLYPRIEALLVLLAIHLASHTVPTQRLVWFYDFIELGSGAAVDGARILAARHDVVWALESALLGAERLIGLPRWRARRSESPKGLASASRPGSGGVALAIHFAREWGVLKGIKYVASRVDPRRFRSDKDAGESVGTWVARTVRDAFSELPLRIRGRQGL